MPKILTSSLAQHNDQAWAALTNALERLLTDTSYDAVTMARVAKAAGMARNTLYNYAADKPSLVAAVTERATGGLLQRIANVAEGPGRPGKRLETITISIIAWFVDDEHRHVVASGLFANPSSSTLDRTTAPLRAIEGLVAQLIEEGVACGDLRSLPNPALTQDLFRSVMEWAVRSVVQRPSDLGIVTEETLRVVRACLGAGPSGVPGGWR